MWIQLIILILNRIYTTETDGWKFHRIEMNLCYYVVNGDVRRSVCLCTVQCVHIVRDSFLMLFLDRFLFAVNPVAHSLTLMTFHRRAIFIYFCVNKTDQFISAIKIYEITFKVAVDYYSRTSWEHTNSEYIFVCFICYQFFFVSLFFWRKR